MEQDKRQFATRAIHSGEGVDPTTKALNTPIYQTSTFAFEKAHELQTAIVESMNNEPGVCLYSRTTNPTTMALEKKIASLESADDAAVMASGMGAVSTTLLGLLNEGDHLIASSDIFIVSRILLDDVLPSKGISVTHANSLDLSDVEKQIQPNTKAIFIEALSNPRLELSDLPALAELAHKNGLLFIVDNTFLSPYLLRPLEWGADLVIHSATKYIAGHGDALAGVVAGSKKLVDRARYYNDNLGTAISPFNSWLLLRGARTLSVRLEAQSKNALAVAKYLEARPEVELVRYPGLERHPQHTLAQKLLPNGYGGMVSFHLKGGKEVMEKFVDNVEMFPIAVSLGDVQTLIYPKPKDGNLIRLSVGIEHIDDIIADLEQSFAKL